MEYQNQDLSSRLEESQQQEENGVSMQDTNQQNFLVKVFESRDVLKSWIQELGKMHKIYIVVIKFDFSKRITPRIMFGRI